MCTARSSRAQLGAIGPIGLTDPAFVNMSIISSLLGGKMIILDVYLSILIIFFFFWGGGGTSN